MVIIHNAWLPCKHYSVILLNLSDHELLIDVHQVNAIITTLTAFWL